MTHGTMSIDRRLRMGYSGQRLNRGERLPSRRTWYSSNTVYVSDFIARNNNAPIAHSAHGQLSRTPQNVGGTIIVPSRTGCKFQCHASADWYVSLRGSGLVVLGRCCQEPRALRPLPHAALSPTHILSITYTALRSHSRDSIPSAWTSS